MFNYDIKECALELWSHGWPLQDVCRMFQVSTSSCYRWRRMLEEEDSVGGPLSYLAGGRAKVLRKVALTALDSLYDADSDTSLEEACVQLGRQHGLTVTSSSLCTLLQDIGLILHKRAAEQNKVAREEFQAMLRTDFVGDGSEFVVVGEMRPERMHHGQQGRIRDVFIKAEQYSMCAALTIKGYIAACPIPGLFTADDFYIFIATEVLPQMRPFPQSRSILVLDHDRAQHNPELVKLVEDAGCLLLFLPPESPDLSPVYESFDILKAYMRDNAKELRYIRDPFSLLLEVTGYISSEDADGMFRDAGYIVEP